MTYGTYDGSAFATEYIKRKREIFRLSRTQRVPGLTPEEVKAELESTLWHAFQTFDPAAGLTVGQWWWAIWINRKSDLIASWFAQRNTRRHQDLLWFGPDQRVDVAEAFSPMIELVDLCPSDDRIERTVWRMILYGFSGMEIKRRLHLSRRRYDAIVDRWQTDDLRRLLT